MDLFYDIDGVVANIDHRLHFLKSKDYDSFYSDEQLEADTKILAGVRLIYDLMYASGDFCHANAITGRPERTRFVTAQWLIDHGLPDGRLLMRKDGDHRPSGVVKVKLLMEYMERMQSENPAEEAFYFVDDDPKNVKAVQEAFPNAICLVFGAKRLGGDNA